MGKYKTNSNVMDNIDSEEKAYWLGFFYADAYNNEKRGRVVIELQKCDKNHLIKCASFFGNPRPPFEQLKNKGKHIAYRLELNSKHLTQVLNKLGCHQTKSFDITFPNWINEALIKHFIRGYFDGDGCIYINSSNDQLGVQIVSTEEFLTATNDILKKINVNPHITHPKKYKNNTWRLDFGGSRQVLRFCDWIYQDATIYLDRKYEIYKNYKENHIPRFK